MPLVKRQESESKALLALSAAFFDHADYATWVKESYDQALEIIKALVTIHFRVAREVDTSAKERISYEIWMSNVRFEAANHIEASAGKLTQYPVGSIRTGATYACKMVADANLKITLLQTQDGMKDHHRNEVFHLFNGKEPPAENENPSFTVTLPQEFSANLPIVVRSSKCSMRSIDPTSAYLIGEDFADVGGYVILDGSAKHIGGIYSYIFNRPNFREVKYTDQIARVEIISQADVIGGNSYRVVPMVKTHDAKVPVEGSNKSLKLMDIIIEFAPTGEVYNKVDSTERSYNVNTIPIQIVFAALGCINDRQIIEYIFPMTPDDLERINIVRNAFSDGYNHKEAREFLTEKTSSGPTRVTTKDALLYIGEKIYTRTYKNDLLHWAQEVVAPFLDEIQVPEIHGKTKLEAATQIYYEYLVTTKIKALIDWYYLPSLGKDNKKKCQATGQLVSGLIDIVLGKRKGTDYTDMQYKSVQLIGYQFATEFKSRYNTNVISPLNEMVSSVASKNSFSVMRSSIRNEFKSQLSPKGAKLFTEMKDAIRTVTISSSSDKGGQPRLLGETLDPKSVMYMWSKYRENAIRRNAGERQVGVVYDQRRSHASYLWLLCPDQTPESGAQVGRYHQPTLYTVQSSAVDPTIVIQLAKEFGESSETDKSSKDSAGSSKTDKASKDKTYTFITETPRDISNYTTIYINYSVFGYVEKGQQTEDFYKYMLSKRRSDPRVDYRTGISVDYDEASIYLTTDGGRLMCPLIPIDALPKPEFKTYLQALQAKQVTWNDGLKNGFIEYVDAQMMHNCVVAQDIETLKIGGKTYTHVALPCGTVGILSAINTGTNRNVGVRTILATSHVKQAIGRPYHNWTTRFLTDVNIMHAPESPMVRSAIYDVLNLARYAFGKNIVIATGPFTENQEDSLIMNQAAIDRFYFTIHRLTTNIYQVEGNETFFGTKPYNMLHMPKALESAYSKVDPNVGVPTVVGTEIWTGDVIAAKYGAMTKEEMEKHPGFKHKDASEIYSSNDMKTSRHPTPARVVAVHNAGVQAQKQPILLGVTRPPIVGDKFSSTHAQKGTIGATVLEEDMPYNTDGIRPTILFNDISIDKRKTLGHLFELLIGKVAALAGSRIECTPFLDDVRTEDYGDYLRALGLKETGAEVMYDGKTGQPYVYEMMMGSMFYIRQRHMVIDKSYVRYSGSREMFTRQATHGRAKNGGMRISEMESNIILAAGAAQIHRDSYHNRGAPHLTVICSKCGGLGYPDASNPKIFRCDKDGLLPEVRNHVLRTPYNVQLLTNVLSGASIGWRTILR